MSSRILAAGSAQHHPFRWGGVGDSPCSGQPAGGPAWTSMDPPAGAQGDLATGQSLADAREESRRQGEQAGYQRARAEFDGVMNRMLHSIADIAGLKPRLRHEAEGPLVELSIAIARRILRRQITIDPEAVAGLARSALDALNLREVVEVRVHPSQAQIVADGIARIGAPVAIRVIGDSSLEAGAVTIETSHGTLDASVSTQLEEIERGFADIASGRTGQ